VIADGAAPVVAPGLKRPQRPSRLQYTAPSADAPGQVEQRADKASGEELRRVGRNDLCPCGSGRKYKRCHGDPRNRG
jgi:preprotein translocase subunit SecA